MSTPGLPKAGRSSAKSRPDGRSDSERGPRGPLRILVSARLLVPLLVLAAGLVGSLASLLIHWRSPQTGDMPLLVSFLLALSLGAFLLAGMRLRGRLLLPLANLEESVTRIGQGEPGASAALQAGGLLDGLARDIASLNAELTDLYEDMDSRVARQTMRLAQKTASIKILYDVAAGINQAQGLDELLLRFLRVIKEMVNGRAASVHLVMPDGRRRLVGSIGLDDDLVRDRDRTPVDLCLCGKVLSAGDILCRNEARYCSRIYGRLMLGDDRLDLVTLPLEHRDELLGIYRVFVDKPGVSGREDIMELLFSIGHHLGIAVAKLRSDAEAQRLSILEERSSLAHELHDSLAQTLAGLRFQVRMLEDGLSRDIVPEEAQRDLARVRSGLDEAHTELRSLLAGFRAPMDRGGLVPALERLADDLRRRSGIRVLFQNNCTPFELPASSELQVTRIAQEALANIRKHARAHTVRVLLKRSGGYYVLLVEDDGVGFAAPSPGGQAGERIGLSIMQERARRIGAELRVESEPDEGTRLELMFSDERAHRPNQREAA